MFEHGVLVGPVAGDDLDPTAPLRVPPLRVVDRPSAAPPGEANPVLQPGDAAVLPPLDEGLDDAVDVAVVGDHHEDLQLAAKEDQLLAAVDQAVVEAADQQPRQASADGADAEARHRPPPLVLALTPARGRDVRQAVDELAQAGEVGGHAEEAAQGGDVGDDRPRWLIGAAPPARVEGVDKAGGPALVGEQVAQQDHPMGTVAALQQLAEGQHGARGAAAVLHRPVVVDAGVDLLTLGGEQLGVDRLDAGEGDDLGQEEVDQLIRQHRHGPRTAGPLGRPHVVAAVDLGVDVAVRVDLAHREDLGDDLRVRGLAVAVAQQDHPARAVRVDLLQVVRAQRLPLAVTDPAQPIVVHVVVAPLHRAHGDDLG